MPKKYLVRVGLAGWVILALGPATAVWTASWEKYLLVIPPHPADEASRRALPAFGVAFREVMAQAATSLPTLVFLKDDELQTLAQVYRWGEGEPEPALMERVADDREIALLYGSYRVAQERLVITLRVIPGRNEEARTFTVEGKPSALRALFDRTLKETLAVLDLSVRPEEQSALAHVPGTDSWSALEPFVKAVLLLRPDPRDPVLCRQALPLLERSLLADRSFPSALALQISCRLAVDRPQGQKALQRTAAENRKVLDAVRAAAPSDPWVQNAHLELLLAEGLPAEAVTQGERILKVHPSNYRTYLLLAQAYRLTDAPAKAEALLLRGLDQQGTAVQKLPFQLELGLLLLKRKDDRAEAYLRAVLEHDPQRADLRYLRASALYRLGRHLDAMSEVQRAEALRTWPALSQLKAMISLALGNVSLQDEDIDQAYTYTTIAVQLRPRHFETNLLLAKVLRKKGLFEEARAQLDKARSLAHAQRAYDHYLLGVELVAQGAKEMGAQELVTYLKLNPRAPERADLITQIRILRGQDEEE